MAVFVAISVLLAVVVFATVLWPLWRESRGIALGAVLALSLAALAAYQLVGTPAAIDAPAVAATPRSMDEAVVQLKAELERHPERADGWQLLARSYEMLDRRPEARDAYARAVKLTPDDPDLLVQAAQARLFADPGKKIDAEAVAMLRRALELQPQQQRARWFLGVWQRQEGRPAEAAETWEPLLAQVDAATANTLRVQVDAARKDAGLPPLPAAQPPAASAGSANALTVKVSLDPDFASRVRLRGDASVFVIARIPDGPPMPVAAEKHALQDLPMTITLDDADSPMPTQKLSALKEVEVFARLSNSGEAMRQEGDLDSKPVRVKLPATGAVELVIGAK
ncbi:tetratricopeptide repeat protein [Luteimonas sp. 22616]|uniref:tetratricopeptide repeat protein n=1 Tax=Luteimonas sp. 22616 TaxID=3453951 RepID=UPI003F83A95F